MIGVLIVPTGLGAAIGGHAGDANPAAKLIASCCDTLITHPNVVNASDINEMTENTLYVPGAMLDAFLMGAIKLTLARPYNKILVVANPPLTEETINAVTAARVTVGCDATILELSEPLLMVAKIADYRATGDVYGWESLLNDIKGRDFDALAIHTPIDVPRDVALRYYREGGINPWGGVEAILSNLIFDKTQKPVAHAPLENVDEDDKELFLVYQESVVPRITPEAISNCYLHSVLKGLHRAPRVGVMSPSHPGLVCGDIDFLLSPFGCWGWPHGACQKRGIPVIVVHENKVLQPVSHTLTRIVENYLEAAGLIMSMRAGVTPESVSTSLGNTSCQLSREAHLVGGES